jgi:hypothetical protein
MRNLTKITAGLSVFCLVMAGVSFAINGDNWTWVHGVGMFGAVICAVGCVAALLAEDC